MVETNDLSNQL